MVTTTPILFWRLRCNNYSKEESIQRKNYLFLVGIPILFSLLVLIRYLFQLKQIDFCCFRLLQLGNIAKIRIALFVTVQSVSFMQVIQLFKLISSLLISTVSDYSNQEILQKLGNQSEKLSEIKGPYLYLIFLSQSQSQSLSQCFMQCLSCSFGEYQKINIADIIMNVTMTMTVTKK